MYGRRHRKVPNLYSHEYHLSRMVRCADCGVELHKNHHFVFYGNRCRPCWQAFSASQGNTASY